MVRGSKGVQERIRRGAQVHQVLVLPSKGPAKNCPSSRPNPRG